MFSRTCSLEINDYPNAVEVKAVLVSRGKYIDAATCTARLSSNTVCCDEPGHAECKLKGCTNTLVFIFTLLIPISLLSTNNRGTL